jgi:hypothetical protein
VESFPEQNCKGMHTSAILLRPSWQLRVVALVSATLSERRLDLSNASILTVLSRIVFRQLVPCHGTEVGFTRAATFANFTGEQFWGRAVRASCDSKESRGAF